LHKKLKYINKQLEKFAPLLKAKIKKNGKIGLFAEADIKKNKPLMSIPEHMILTSFDDYPRSYFFYEMLRS